MFIHTSTAESNNTRIILWSKPVYHDNYASGRLLLFLLDPPNVNARDPTKVIVNQTQTANLTCEVFGIPVPNITWIRNSDGSSLSNTTDITIITTSAIPPASLLSILTFQNATKTDESSYTCVGRNGVSNLIETPENDTIELAVQGECRYVLVMKGMYDVV